MEPPRQDSKKTPSESGTPSRKRWSFRRSRASSSEGVNLEPDGKKGFIINLCFQANLDVVVSKQPAESLESQRKSTSIISNILSPFGKLSKVAANSSSSKIAVNSIDGGERDGAERSKASASGTIKNNMIIQDIDFNVPKSSIFTNLFIPNSSNSPLITSPSADSASATKSTFQRVISSTSPLFSWLRTGTRPEETNIMNPILHIATFAMNEEENASGNKCSIHNIMLNDPQQGFWGGMAHDETSTESSDEQDGYHSKMAENFGSSTENVVSPDTIEAVSSLVFVDTQEHSAEEKLQTVFDLPEKEKYYKEFACWLVRSVLLKGHLYITEKHMCFYSSLPIIPVF